jgi:hypothetical protein
MKKLILFFVIIAALFSCSSHYRKGERLFFEEKFEKSKIELLAVPSNSKNYEAARKLIGSIDSIRHYNFRENFIRDSIEIFARRDSLILEEETRRIKRIESLQKDIPTYLETLNTVSQLKTYSTDDLVKKSGVFALIAGRCKAGLRLDAPEINKKAKECQEKLLQIQLKEYPKMRNSYALVLTGELEEFDIWVKCEDPKNKTLVLIGDYFVYDHRIPEVLKLIKPILKELRFENVSFRWSKTYVNGKRYSIISKDDSWLG